MGRHPVERNNDAFNELLERRIAALGDGRRREVVKQATEEAAKMLGVTIHTVLAWCKPHGGKSAIGCPKWRVDMYKLALPPDVSRVSDKTREELLVGLRAVRDSGVMSDASVKAFDKLSRKHKRESV